jgi:hypothetical protein
VPLITVGIGSNVDQTTITQLQQGQAGATANAIATNATRMANLTKAGYPINIFQVNPNNGGNSTEMTNRNSSTYNSGQVEVRRRLAAGLQMQASYAFSKSLTDSNTPTLRDWGGNKGPTTFDIRNGFKMTWIYQLPFGQGRSLLSGAHGVLGKVVSGWEIAGVGRVQSGTPINIVSGRDTFNQNDGGVVLHNMTAKQLQNDVLPAAGPVTEYSCGLQHQRDVRPHRALYWAVQHRGPDLRSGISLGPVVLQMGCQPGEAHADQGTIEPGVPRRGAERLQSSQHSGPGRRGYRRQHQRHRQFLLRTDHLGLPGPQ